MKIAILLVSVLVSNFALADESGYIKDGKTVVVFRDGKKIGEWPKEMDTKRDPSSLPNSDLSRFVRYDEDTVARCYTLTGGALSCVKR